MIGFFIRGFSAEVHSRLSLFDAQTEDIDRLRVRGCNAPLALSCAAPLRWSRLARECWASARALAGTWKQGKDALCPQACGCGFFWQQLITWDDGTYIEMLNLLSFSTLLYFMCKASQFQAKHKIQELAHEGSVLREQLCYGCGESSAAGNL